MKIVLIIEDNITYTHALSSLLSSRLDAVSIHAADYRSARDVLEEKSGEISIALVDFFLPDSEKGEAIDLVQSYHIPVVVMTANLTDDMQELFQSKKVIDYVMKEGPHSIDYIIATVDRLFKNKGTKILVIDDSPTAQSHIGGVLMLHRYQVITALNGKDALEVLNANPDTKVILLDYNLPDTDGLALLRQIRESFPMNKLAIIGLSGEENPRLSIRYLKEGANDFIIKPFISEHLYSRITLNLTILEQFDKLYELSVTDHLTRVYNRRYFFELAPKMFKNNRRQGAPVTVAMIDLDHFKKVNDTYGHMAGDAVLKSIASTLKKFFRESDIIARFGGEEFCILANGMDREASYRIFDKFRKKIEKSQYKVCEGTFSVTVSIGLCTDELGSLTDMIKAADDNLYVSKKSGRNRVT